MRQKVSVIVHLCQIRDIHIDVHFPLDAGHGALAGILPHFHPEGKGHSILVQCQPEGIVLQFVQVQHFGCLRPVEVNHGIIAPACHFIAEVPEHISQQPTVYIFGSPLGGIGNLPVQHDGILQRPVTQNIQHKFNFLIHLVDAGGLGEEVNADGHSGFQCSL